MIFNNEIESNISKNVNALPILKQHPSKIHWTSLSYNPAAIELLEANQDKIDWFNLSSNPAIFEIDYDLLQKRCTIYKEELMMVCFHPKRLQYFLDTYNYDIGDDTYFD